MPSGIECSGVLPFLLNLKNWTKFGSFIFFPRNTFAAVSIVSIHRNFVHAFPSIEMKNETYSWWKKKMFLCQKFLVFEVPKNTDWVRETIYGIRLLLNLPKSLNQLAWIQWRNWWWFDMKMRTFANWKVSKTNKLGFCAPQHVKKKQQQQRQQPL